MHGRRLNKSGPLGRPGYTGQGILGGPKAGGRDGKTGWRRSCPILLDKTLGLDEGDAEHAIAADFHSGHVTVTDLAVDDPLLDTRELGETFDGYPRHVGRALGCLRFFHRRHLPLVGCVRLRSVVKAEGIQI